MGDTFNNSGTFSNSGGDLNLTQGTNAIGKQEHTYNTAQQIPIEELLKLLADIKVLLPELPDKVQAKLRNEVEGAELEAQEEKPDREEIAAKLTSAQRVLAAIPPTIAVALQVGELIGRALKAAGM